GREIRERACRQGWEDRTHLEIRHDIRWGRGASLLVLRVTAVTATELCTNHSGSHRQGDYSRVRKALAANSLCEHSRCSNRRPTIAVRRYRFPGGHSHRE